MLENERDHKPIPPRQHSVQNVRPGVKQTISYLYLFVFAAGVVQYCICIRQYA